LARQETQPKPPLPERPGRRIRHYTAQITRVASSAIARSCESEIPCVSAAGPPLLQRSAGTRKSGVQAARRHSGDVAARRRSWLMRTNIGRHPRAAPREPRICRPPPRAHPLCTPGGRGDGQGATRGGTVRRGAGCAMCVMPPSRAIRKHIARRNCATGVQAAHRRPGEVAARRRSWIMGTNSYELLHGRDPLRHCGR
jgi:hypothetical protein